MPASPWRPLSLTMDLILLTVQGSPVFLLDTISEQTSIARLMAGRIPPVLLVRRLRRVSIFFSWTRMIGLFRVNLLALSELLWRCALRSSASIMAG